MCAPLLHTRWWLENAYTRWPDPIVITSNWQVLIDDHPVLLQQSASATASRCARRTTDATHYVSSVDQAIRAAGLAHNLTLQYLALIRYMRQSVCQESHNLVYQSNHGVY
jgi:hypothetical protein